MNEFMYILFKQCKADYYACNGVVGDGIPADAVNLIHLFYLAIKILIPVTLVIFGAIGLFKGITSDKDDERSAALRGFIKKLIVAIVVFLTLTLTQFVFSLTDSEDEHGNVLTCIDELIEGKCETYIKPEG